MKKGKRAGDSPIGVDVVEGKSYFWCTCGKVQNNHFVMVLIKVRNSNRLFIKLINQKKFFL